jgi:peptide subunit release factor 1 (eRF1)
VNPLVATTMEGVMLNESLVHELSHHRGEPAVSTVYLDVDGRHRPVAADYQAAFERLADDLARRAGRAGDARLLQAVERDLERMRSWLGQRLDRSTTRGLALFSCSVQGFFEVVQLPRPVRDEAGFGPTARVGQLAALLDQYEPVVVALIDRRRLRLLRVELGEIQELPGIVDVEPRAVDTSVELGTFERHSEELELTHYRRAAEIVEHAVSATDRLLLGGTDEAVAGLEDQLHVTARRRISGRVEAALRADVREILDSVLEVDELAERHSENEAVELLRQRLAGNFGAVVGLEATLEALTEGRVGTLLVADGFRAPGARCPACGVVSIESGACRSCGAPTVEVDDIVEVAVDEAVAHRSRVEFCHATDLDQLGSIGAIERY